MRKSRILSLFLVVAMMVSLSGAGLQDVQAAKKKAAKTTKITVKKGNSKKVTIKKAKKAKAKKIKWTIKNKKIASVKKSGKYGIKVKGKKVGTTKLTVKYQVKGKWKSLKYKVVVKKKTNTKGTNTNKTTVTKVNLTSLKVVNDRTLQFSLSSAYTLSVNDISVKVKMNKSGSYRRAVEVTGLETQDKKNYTVQLYGNEGLYANDYIQLSISKLTGTKTLEAQYKEKVTAYTEETTYSAEVGNSVSQDFYFYDGVGYSTFSATNLPPGLTYEVEENEMYISGTPTKAGVYNTVLKAVDEMGNTYTQTCRFCIGSADKLVAAATDVYVLDGSYISRGITVAGGSGSYVYSKKDDATGLSFNTSNGSHSGYIYAEGTYAVTVIVTDSNNAALTTSVTFNIHVKKTVLVEGKIKDITGGALKYDCRISAENTDKNAKYMSSNYSYVGETGEYEMKLAPGTWNFMFEHTDSDVKKISYNVTISKDMKMADVVLNICPVILVHPQGVTDFNGVSWKNAKGETIGEGSELWVKPGTHQVESVSSSSNLYTLLNKSTATFTASNKLIQVPVKTVATPENVTFENVTGTFTSSFKGRYKYFIFVPAETGKYNIYSNTGLDTVGIIYDAQCKKITSSDLSTDFKMTNVSLTAGQTYYLGAGYWSSSRSGEFTVYIEKQA